MPEIPRPTGGATAPALEPGAEFAGYTVIRFDTDEDGWEQTIAAYPYVFGEGR